MRLFIVEAPEPLSPEQNGTQVANLERQFGACGIKARVVILDNGWKLSEIVGNGEVGGVGAEAGQDAGAKAK